MLSKEAKCKFDDLKRRSEQRRKNMPSAKTEKDSETENRNAVDLIPHVYKTLAEGESWTYNAEKFTS